MGAVTLAACILRFYRIGGKSIWLDEAFSVWIAGHSLWEGWQWLIRIDQHPPLYYSLLHLWIELFGELQGAVRTLSALFSTLTVPIFYVAGRRLLDRSTAAVAVGILAISPFHVQFAQETRMYALLTLEVACVLFFLARLLTRQDARGRDWVGLAFAQALVMLTHNTAAVFLPVALNAAMGIVFLLSPSGFGHGSGDLERREPQGESAVEPDGAGIQVWAPTDCDVFWSRWIKYQGLAVLLWLPWAMPFIIQTLDVEGGFWLPPPWPKLVLDTFRNFHFAFLAADFPVRPLWMWSYPFLALAGLIGLLLKGILPLGSRQPHAPAVKDHQQKNGGSAAWRVGRRRDCHFARVPVCPASHCRIPGQSAQPDLLRASAHLDDAALSFAGRRGHSICRRPGVGASFDDDEANLRQRSINRNEEIRRNIGGGAPRRATDHRAGYPDTERALTERLLLLVSERGMGQGGCVHCGAGRAGRCDRLQCHVGADSLRVLLPNVMAWIRN